MAINSAFQAQSNTFAITVGVASSSTPVSFNPTLANQAAAQASGLQSQPPQVRVVNQGTAPVYISFTTAARTAVAPVAGTPSLEVPVQPGEDIVFTLTQIANANSATPYTLLVNTISGTAAQPVLVTFGEGL
jgi:hypothetical protein